MKAEIKPDHTPSVDDEAERVRDIFVKSFRQSESDLDRLLPKNFTSTLSQRDEADEPTAGDEFDWSVTLANVEKIVEAAASSRTSTLAAERRAEIAEAKAKEALHWLRVLHEAVLRGLPDTTSETAVG
ncbi:hypothetical protein [Methylorubrum extorquens]|uniref:hypothetical protein n=1 Tax=Methylorubrum extorquens TaxID=408 RepID=UPI0020A0F821|nr:hypothetical protein [Methylorubrum extorquens]MCP1535747.1 hypothetical protein [Methylorubrum extorquens]